MSARSERTVSVLVPSTLISLTERDLRTAGPYVLVGRIGGGRTGTVYAGVDTRTEGHEDAATEKRPASALGAQPVLAVQVLHSDVAADAATRSRLERRSAEMAGVRGRFAVPLLDADPQAQRPWIAMPYIPGAPLAQHVRKRAAFAQGMLLALAAGTAEALTTYHEAGLAHGDLRPGNIILSPEGPRVLDFSLAAAGDHTALDRAAGWVSPERHGGARASAAGDVFSWGAVMAFAATGRRPFGEEEPSLVRERVRDGEPDLDGVPELLRPLLRQALAKEPDERPSVRTLAEGIITAQGEGSGAAPGSTAAALTRIVDAQWHGIVEPATLPRAVGVSQGRPPRRTARRTARLPMLLGGVVVALALVGGTAAAVSALSGGDGEPEPHSTTVSSPSPTPSAAPTAPRTVTARFGEVPQPTPVEGPWVYTKVKRDTGELLSPSAGSGPDQWVRQWRDVSDPEEPLKVRIAPDAQVYCAEFCLAPGQVYVDGEGRGTYEVTGQDFINYLSWGEPLIVELTITPAPGGGPPTVTEITELHGQ